MPEPSLKLPTPIQPTRPAAVHAQPPYLHVRPRLCGHGCLHRCGAIHASRNELVVWRLGCGLGPGRCAGAPTKTHLQALVSSLDTANALYITCSRQCALETAPASSATSQTRVPARSRFRHRVSATESQEAESAQGRPSSPWATEAAGSSRLLRRRKPPRPHSRRNIRPPRSIGRRCGAARRCSQSPAPPSPRRGGPPCLPCCPPACAHATFLAAWRCTCSHHARSSLT